MHVSKQLLVAVSLLFRHNKKPESFLSNFRGSCQGRPLSFVKFEVPQRQQLASEDSVPETPSYGTEWTFGAQNSLLWYATHLQKHSV